MPDAAWNTTNRRAAHKVTGDGALARTRVTALQQKQRTTPSLEKTIGKTPMRSRLEQVVPTLSRTERTPIRSHNNYNGDRASRLKYVACCTVPVAGPEQRPVRPMKAANETHATAVMRSPCPQDPMSL